mmetsp:Transcript_51255/g.163883  ORF Transcript_51255/g.163883 Transcript_51255/m.163883 type:complete len:162 (+) Transcript_51255:121-606(+)
MADPVFRLLAAAERRIARAEKARYEAAQGAPRGLLKVSELWVREPAPTWSRPGGGGAAGAAPRAARPHLGAAGGEPSPDETPPPPPPPPPPAGDPAEADRAFRAGLVALEAGRGDLALTELGKAAAACPPERAAAVAKIRRLMALARQLAEDSSIYPNATA